MLAFKIDCRKFLRAHGYFLQVFATLHIPPMNLILIELGEEIAHQLYNRGLFPRLITAAIRSKGNVKNVHNNPGMNSEDSHLVAFHTIQSLACG